MHFFWLWELYEPSFLSSRAIFTFVSVISLKEDRNRTTSPFSFLMGTMSNRHQNEDPIRQKEVSFKQPFSSLQQDIKCMTVTMNTKIPKSKMASPSYQNSSATMQGGQHCLGCIPQETFAVWRSPQGTFVPWGKPQPVQWVCSDLQHCLSGSMS